MQEDEDALRQRAIQRISDEPVSPGWSTDGTNRKNPFNVLGVSSGLELKAIRKEYLSLSKLLHPDKTSEPGAAEAQNEISTAFEMDHGAHV